MACVDKGYPWGHHGTNEASVAGSPYPFGECTDHVWRKFHEQGVSVAPHMGDAWEWMRSAGGQGYSIFDHATGSNLIACWSKSAYPPFGHLAYVQATDSGGFTVTEMNFCYSVGGSKNKAADPGHVDERHVGAGDPQPVGFILPNGATAGAGAASTLVADSSGGLLAPLQPELVGIGKAIDSAALQLEANLMTLRNRVTSGAQIGLGAGLALSGGVVIGLSALGRSPSQAARRQVGRVRRRARVDGLPAVRGQFPQSTPQVADLPPGPAPKMPAARASRTLKPSGFGPQDSPLRAKVREAGLRGSVSAADLADYRRMQAGEARPRLRLRRR